MLQKPTKQVYAFAAESWESAESKFTSTCIGKGSKSIRSSPATEDTDSVKVKERGRKKDLPDILFSLVFNASVNRNENGPIKVITIHQRRDAWQSRRGSEQHQM